MSTLQERLRAMANEVAGDLAWCDEAADRIDADAERIMALEADLQRYISRAARREIEIGIIEDILKGDDDFTAMDMEYWGPLHDKAREQVRRSAALEAERDQYKMAAEAEARFADRYKAENAALRADAERYRWLREHAHWEDERDMAPGGRWWAAVIVSKGKPTLDAAIDAARSKT